MNEYEFLIKEEKEAERIDKFLSEAIGDLSRSFLQKLLKEQQVMVNEKPVKANYRLRTGDRIRVCVPPCEELNIEPENIPLDILYEDEDLLVINKPKGMVVHPSAGHTSHTLVNGVLYHCQGNLSGINGVLRPGIVHRIDKDTTGALVICKNDLVHRELAEQLKEHTIKRRYRAIVLGNFKEEEGTVEGPIGRHPVDRKKWPSTIKTEKTRLPITGYWNGSAITVILNAGWRQDGPIRSVSI